MDILVTLTQAVINFLIFTGVSVFLFRKYQQTHLPNLLYLGGAVFFALMHFLGAILLFILGRQYNSILILFDGACVFCTLLFIQKSFYQSKKSPFALFVVINLASTLAALHIYGANPTGLHPYMYLFMNFQYMIAFGWQAFKCLKVFFTIRNDPIEPIVKTKYLLFGSGGGLLSGSYAIYVAANLLNKLYFHEVLNDLAYTLITVYGILIYLTWVMPKSFKKWVNRKWVAQDDYIIEKDVPIKLPSSNFLDGQSQDELEDDYLSSGKTLPKNVHYRHVVELLGSRLTDLINRSPMMGRGLARLAIRDYVGLEIRVFDLAQVNEIIEIPLRRHLERLHVINCDSVIEELLNNVRENQSMLTMLSY